MPIAGRRQDPRRVLAAVVAVAAVVTAPLTLSAEPSAAATPEAPVITSANHATFEAGTATTFTVTTTGDPTPTISKTGALPSGLSFTDNGDGTATLGGTPAAGTGGSYPLTISAANIAPPDAAQAFTLTVNEAPYFSSSNHTTFTAGTAGSFTVTTVAGVPSATTLTQSGAMPSGVSFTDNGNGTATIAGTPVAGTGGFWSFTITAANGVGPGDLQTFSLAVLDAPRITSANHVTFAVGSPGSFTVTTVAGMPPATTLTETGALPAGMTFTDNGDGTATLAGTPAAGTGGDWPLQLVASNGQSSSQAFTLTVSESPSFTSAPSTTFTEGLAGTFTVACAGTPAPGLFEVGALPSGVSFVDNLNGTATLSGTPAAGLAGSYPLQLSCLNGIGAIVVQPFNLTVASIPVLTAPASAGALIGVPFNLVVSATGFPTPALSATTPLPAGLTLVDNGNGTGSLTGTPADGTYGDVPITLRAANAGGTADQVVNLRIRYPVRFVPPVSPSASPSASPAASVAPPRPRLRLVAMTPDIPAGAPAVLVASGGGQRLVELVCYVRPALAYRVVRMVTPALDAATFTLRPLGNMRCYARYAGELADASPSVIVNVYTALSLAARRTGPLTYLFTGRALPRVPQVVTILRRDARGRLLPTSTVTTRRDGTFAVSRTFLGGGTFDFVARSQTAYNAPGVSPPLTLTLH